MPASAEQSESLRQDGAAAAAAAPSPLPAPRRRRIRVLPILVTLVAVAVAAGAAWAMWQTYMGAPWTRDGRVRAYVVTIAPEIAGRIIELPIADNQLVRKGDVLMLIDPTDYKIAAQRADAALAQAKADEQNAEAESKRRQELGDFASQEARQTYLTKALTAQAAAQEALANQAQARVNLERTRIVSPVNGYVTNLVTQSGDYVQPGQNRIALVNADSFWIDGYFEETVLGSIHEGDPALVKLMGYDQPVRGHVAGIARGIDVANALSDQSGLATVNPIFTWVRLAQRVPVRIQIDDVPKGVLLVAGMTATVQIDPKPGNSAAINQQRP